MEVARRIVVEIARTADSAMPSLPLLHRSLLPLLSAASFIYRISLHLRRALFAAAIFPSYRMPVPVVSVGNLTWGGNGKTPMVELLARIFDAAGVPPLILTRGYGGADEAKMLKRHLRGTSTYIGVGSNRTAIGSSMIARYGCIDPQAALMHKFSCKLQRGHRFKNVKIGAILLDDGMQHWSLKRDVEIVMVNALMPWGNNHLIPRGSLRESLGALNRADIVVIHHADHVYDSQLAGIKASIREVNASIPVFCSRLAPSHLFRVNNHTPKKPLSTVYNLVVLCVSAVGCPDAFVQGVQKMGALHVSRLDFSDHHRFDYKDIQLIRETLNGLEIKFKSKVVTVLTEKDYDRDPVILEELNDLEVYVLCSSLRIIPLKGRTTVDFCRKLRKILLAGLR